MKKSTEVKKSSNCSWRLGAVTSVFHSASSDQAKIISLELFKRLPVDVLLPISSYLPSRYTPRAQKNLANRALMFPVSYDDKDVDSALKSLLQEDYLLDKFLYLITIEGEDNQDQAETILKQLLEEENYALISKLISSEKTITDAAGRRFKSISALGYTFWAGDTRMSRMLEKYINILEEKGYESKKTLFKECQHIEGQGIEFTFNGECVENSKHFDWEPLIAVYNAYIAAATVLMNANNGNGEWSDEAWEPLNILWLKIGEELAKVPTHVAQEYCSDLPFSPLSNFKAALNSPALKRTVKFYNWMSDKADKEDSWFIRGLANLNLGRVFSIYKGLGASAYGRGFAPPAGCGGATVDLAAIAALCEMRTVNDHEQTLENLKPFAPNLDFHP